MYLKTLINGKFPLFLLLGSLLLVFGVMTIAQAEMNSDQAYSFNEDGTLVKPEGYREWIYVGTPVTPNDMNNGKAAFPEFHNVYIHPKNYKKWKKTGAFPNGTILIKELVSVGTKSAPSGNGYFMGEFIGLEATIKDSKRFKGEPGNWAYFSFTRKGKSPALKAKAMPTDKCNFCHQGFAKDDWVFTQYYPVLRAAKPGNGQ